ncbi:hypothetical protein K490DRAFT_53585 [Saccharata proteae CBS 121410]|uniref:Uncharacterized protein n=1 Tax=Saccharata proteae CBS 121410 TaxID=1314787 RepID=A0A9P4HZA8_9PEZI|nr:hypothetical protein K490DRAFT_53585 [Saccharata proteae CBS 121410]
MSTSINRVVRPGRIADRARVFGRQGPKNTVHHDARSVPYRIVASVEVRRAQSARHNETARGEREFLKELRQMARESSRVLPSKASKREGWRSRFRASDLEILEQHLPWLDGRVGGDGFPLADDTTFWDEAYNALEQHRSTAPGGPGSWRNKFSEYELDVLDNDLPTLDGRVGDDHMPYSWDKTFWSDARAVLATAAKNNVGWRRYFTKAELEILDDKAPFLDGRVGADRLPLWSDHTFYVDARGVIESASSTAPANTTIPSVSTAAPANGSPVSTATPSTTVGVQERLLKAYRRILMMP